MIFHVDGGRTSLEIWVTPNNPIDTPRIRVVLDGGDVREFEASVMYAALQEWGWHSTGLCGFSVNEASCPGYDGAQRLEIFDIETNTLLFRRIEGSATVAARVLLIDPGITPRTELPLALFPHFAMSYFDAQNLSKEILNTVIQMKQVESLLICGGLLYNAYEDLISQNEFVRVMLVDDPYVELARRLLWLRRRAAAAAESPAQSWRGAALAAPCAFAAGLDLTNRTRLRKAFTYLDDATANFLANPITRHLSSKYRDEPIREFNAYLSLDVLARLEVVGHRRYWNAFVVTVLDRLGLSLPMIEPAEVPADVTSLAEALRGTRTVAGLLDMDLYLERAVLAAVGQHWQGVEA